MEIRKSTIEDFNHILNLYEQAREFMKEHNNPTQWGNYYPEASLIEEDIVNEKSYVCIDENKIVGTFMYAEEKEPTYATIVQGDWVNNNPYGVVHRIASSAQKRGVATFCLDWCYRKCKNLRIDTHKDNFPMQRLLKKNGFVLCGIIYLENGDERIAYQKADMLKI